MAQPLQSINLVAPAFKGVNTEDSPLAQDPSFAEVADNAIIDKRGRLGARKGINLVTTNKTELGTDRIHSLHYFYDNAGNEKIFSTGNNKILSGTETLVDETPAAYTITANNWKIVNFNNSAYFFQRGYEPLVYNATLGAVTPMSDGAVGGTLSSNQYCHEAIAAYGRLWCVGTALDKNTIYWSDLLDGTNWTTGSSGSINVQKAWPDGYDEVRALAAHNDALIIFGEHSILVFSGAFSPATMQLQDTIAGIGCICRNSVQHIGTDVLFMSFSGLNSLGRTIQEKSLPITDLSRNVKDQIIDLIENRQQPTASVYSPENSFYLITFPGESTTLCFDLRGRLENGAYRVTRWPSSLFKAWERTTDGILYTGTANGIGKYDGHTDEGEPYLFKYVSPGLTFGDPSKLKFLKKLRPTIVGGSSETVYIKWAYDFDESFKTQTFTLGADTGSIAYFNVAEYAEYGALSSYGIASTGTGTPSDPYVVNKYLGDFASAPTVGSGGGALLDGDSYFDTTDSILYVYISSAWVDIDTLTVTTSFEYSGGTSITRKTINTTNGGTIITVGIEADINGTELSVQEINVLALLGKVL